MLVSLQIRNFALIENATIEFGEGLNVLSGETGAGKSIIVQALEILLGGRGSAELIRSGEEEAEVTGFFTLPDREFTLRRLVPRNGKNRAYLNERPVPVSVLEDTGEEVVDLAGQHEHQVLLQPSKHLLLLDEFAGLEDAVAAYRSSLARHKDQFSARESLVRRQQESREREEFLRFQQKELSEARLQEGEEDLLRQERERVKYAVRLGEICLRGEEGLETGEESVVERIGKIAKEVHQAAEIDPAFGVMERQIGEAGCLLQEAARGLRQRGQGLSFDPERLQELEDRLALISRLKKKYGGSLETLRRKEQEIGQSLTLLDSFEEEVQKQDDFLAKSGEGLLQMAGNLSRARRTCSQRLSREVEKEIRDLGMASAHFLVQLGPLGGPPAQGLVNVGQAAFGERGAEDAEFLIAPNPGEGFRPLSKIASGGEISRIFLAIKKVLGKTQGAPTCIFDEVDSGIGGGVAEVVGRNLFLLARKKQVICVTHLPQIACYADHHFVIEKRVEGGRTQTDVQRLGRDQREQEIARMLAGIRITEKAVAHAREMLKNALGGG